ncbi:MAG: hypothetical protein ACI4RD_09500 [Kiritimatiellia bacterium]
MLVYDGFPTEAGGYGSEADQNPTAKGAITHAEVVGFKDGSAWEANGTGVVYTHGAGNGLELPTFASSVAKGTAVGTSIGCHNAASSNTSYERIKFRPLKDDTTFAAEAAGEDGKLHFRLLLKADEVALANLMKDATDSSPITANNWYGAGFFYAESTPASGSHSLLRSGGRSLWFGLVKDKNGDTKVIMNVRGWDTAQQSAIVTLCDAQPGETYLCYAEITVDAAGPDQVRAFAMPTGDWSVGNAKSKLDGAQTVEACLLDTGKPLNYLAAGGAYCTNSGRFSADEIGVATVAQDLIDLVETDDVFFSTVELTGTPTVGITARASLGNPPDAFSMACYMGESADDLQLVKTWADQTPATTSWEWPVTDPQWGKTYYAQFVMTPATSTGQTLASRVVSCSPSATVVWTGLAGDNAWETADNWNPALVPTDILDAYFTNAAASLTHARADCVRGLVFEGGSRLTLTQTAGAALAADSLTVVSGFGNRVTVDGGSFSVANDAVLGTGRSSDSDRHDPVRGSNGGLIELKNGRFALNGVKLLGNTYDDANRFVVSNATVRMTVLETVYNQNLAQGNVSFEAYDSVVSNATHFQLHGLGTSAFFRNCAVTNGGVLRLGQGNTSNAMRLLETDWTQSGREVIVGRKGSQRLEIGTGSSLEIASGSDTSSGNLYLGHGSDGGGTGTLVISNAVLTAAKNIYMPQDQRYDSQYALLYETDGGKATVNCQNLYVGTTGYNGSTKQRTGDQASHFSMNGGTISCYRYLNIGAVYETCSNRLSIAGTTAHCKAGLFGLVNASILAIRVPAGGFAAPALIEVTANGGDAPGTATISADSSIEVDVSEYQGGTLTLLRAVKIDSGLSADAIAAKVKAKRNQQYGVWFETNEKGETVALKLKVAKGGHCLVIR